ncbi:hypothetical protein L1887_60617 [Cichorium endivia]|nr:hypothetical protein L1887_60617 [Cichorium endivia]
MLGRRAGWCLQLLARGLAVSERLEVELQVLLEHLALHLVLGSALLGLARVEERLELLQLLLAVELGVVVAVTLEHHTLVQRQVARVHRHAMVVLLAALHHALPVALLLAKVETRRVGDEDHGEHPAEQAEPRDHPELGVVVNVVVEDRGCERTELAHGGRNAVRGGTDGCGEHLGGEEEGGGVGAELVEEGREEVDGLERLDARAGHGERVVERSADDEEDEIGDEAVGLHPLAAVLLVVDEERSHVVADERDDDVVHVVDPGGLEAAGVVGDDADEDAREDLVAVEEEVVGEPAASSSEQTVPVVVERELERDKVVARSVETLLCGLEGGILVLHAIVSDVGEVEGEGGDDAELHTEGPLRRSLAVGTVERAVEDEQADDQDSLVGQLAPTLHEERERHLASSVHAVAGGGSTTCARSLHRSRRGHGVLSAYADSIYEDGPCVADDPAVEGGAPHGGEHDGSERHDECILHHSEASSDPVALDADKDLSDDDSDDLEVVDCVEPVFVADGVVLPALGPYSLEEGREVSDGEEGVALDKEAKTGDDVVAEVGADGRERVALEHATDLAELAASLCVGLCVDPRGLFPEGEVGPVGFRVACVRVGGEERLVESCIDVWGGGGGGRGMVGAVS